LGDRDLTVAGLIVGEQDLVGTRVEGTAATTGRAVTGAAVAAAPAAVTAPATTSAVNAATATAETSAENPTGEFWKRAATGAHISRHFAVATGAEKTTTAAATRTECLPAAAAIAAGAAIEAGTVTAVRPGETALAEAQVAPAAATGDDQRRVSRADHETPTATPRATLKVHARATNRDLQGFACSQAVVAADLGA
jgi:hypothetical protein